MAFEDMQYWEQQRNVRLTASGRSPWAIGHYESARGGVSWVRGQLIISRDHAKLIDGGADGMHRHGWDPLEAWPDSDLLLFGPTADGPGIGDDWTYLEAVAQLREELRSDHAVPDPVVAPHYVLSGEMLGTVPRGGPDSPPHMSGPVTPPASWGVGDPVVAVVDTGIDEGQPWAASIAHAAGDVDPLYSQGPDILGSQAGHGTFIASLIERMAGGGVPQSAIRVLDVDGAASELDVVLGLQRLRLNAIPPTLLVVNLSLGGFTDDGGWTSEPGSKGEFPESDRDRVPLGLAAELTHWAASKVVFVACAGNDGQDRPFWPAALADTEREKDTLRPTFVAVGSLQQTLDPSAFTNTGEWVSVSTLGEDIVSDYPLGRFPLTSTYDEQFVVRAARWSGTSFAAPLVAAEIVRTAREDPAQPRSAVEAWARMRERLSRTIPGLGAVWDPRDGESGPVREPQLP